MGFFKKIGSTLKRAVSLNNLKRAVTGNFSAIGNDVLRIVSTEDPKVVREREAKAKADAEAQNLAYVPPAPVVVPVLPKEIETILDGKGVEFNNNLTTKLSQNKLVQDLTSTAVNTGIKAYWEKYKAWLLGFLFFLIMFFTLRWAFFSGKSRKGARR